MHLERAFAHILDCGGMRRTTLRGLENLNKRFKLAAAFYNLSQLMRKLFGIGTPRQWEAARAGGFGAFFWIIVLVWREITLTMDFTTNLCQQIPSRCLWVAAIQSQIIYRIGINMSNSDRLLGGRSGCVHGNDRPC